MTSGTDTQGHDPELHALRASSFGARAEEYARHRPDYPEAAIEWALDAGNRPPADILDLAAGTGILTGGLLAVGRGFPEGPRVMAVEPDPAMRAELARRYPDAAVVEGRAERIPLPDAQMDAVVVGQAFHWFDKKRAMTEIARVLRPGGVLGALWNFEDERVAWVAELGKLKNTGVSRNWTGNVDLPAHPCFDAVETATFAHAHRRTAESLTATIATQSHVLVVPEQERVAVLGRVRDYLRSCPETAGEFDLPLRTITVRARRR